MSRFAAFDIGSNTVRCLVADDHDGAVAPVAYLRRITRLGGGYTPEAGLSAEAQRRTLQALDEMATQLGSYGAIPCRAVATQAMRLAVNGEAFAARIKDATGIPVDIISGDDEARLSAAGIVAALRPTPSRCLFFDIGGGSTEFGVLVDGELAYFRSFPIGVVRLCEDCADDSQQQAQIDAVLQQLQDDLAGTVAGLALGGEGTLAVGTAGTVTTMAALDLAMTDYDWRRVNNHSIPLERLYQLHDQLAALNPVEREALPGMEKGRGDLIVPGLRLVLSILHTFGMTTLTVSDFGLLEGVVLDLARRPLSP